ncbi:3-hydroxyacyl-CoA dehydrogenase family protein [Homoserinimonas sp. OAct 916]|uniref:3-hydroxyacyl-CoA dehydrogenase family protein n=1 Tax=Homoserinimonas sp. OAct 916 TaxID=2211450 RepID=UPI00210606C0|nr:3-hydroxyacyl-CoA dehydrogenase family protein [Homoserinimonas sp. OAct 916]
MRSDTTRPDDVGRGDGVPEHVGVLGGGRMGAGIAHAFAVSGSRVTVVERDEAAAQAALERIRRDLARSIERGLAVSLDELLARVAVGTDAAAFADAGLVIEAVPEDPELKRSSLARIEAEVSPEAAIATNTSSLSITGLAAGLAHPNRFIGLHFFNPVPASGLVEIVLGEHTDNILAAAARNWVTALGKTPVTVNDAPGFASSRLGVAIGLEAIRMVEEGVASPEDIDSAMVLGYKYPIGPLRLTDIVGLDVRLGIAEYLHSQLGERFRPPDLLRSKVAAGELGRKSGRGFFDWSTEGAESL